MTTWPDDSSLFLMQWATRRVGESSRMNTRAWAVMAHLERRGHGVGSATLGSAQVQKWLVDYHSMGLVGLMDAPRQGRPVKVVSERSMDAQWRAARLSGTVGKRVHRHAVPVYSIDALQPLASLFVWNELRVMAFTAEDLDQHESLKGAWVDVTRRMTAACAPSSAVRVPSLVDALQAVRVMAPPSDRAQQEQCERFAGRLRALCAKYRDAIDVVVSAPPVSQRLRTLLVGFRKAQLWARQHSRTSGVLRSLRFHANGASCSLHQFLSQGAVLQPPMALQASPRLAVFFSAMSDPSPIIFEWHRRPDDPPSMGRHNDQLEWVP